MNILGVVADHFRWSWRETDKNLKYSRQNDTQLLSYSLMDTRREAVDMYVYAESLINNSWCGLLSASLCACVCVWQGMGWGLIRLPAWHVVRCVLSFSSFFLRGIQRGVFNSANPFSADCQWRVAGEWGEIGEIYKEVGGMVSPPLSLSGQLL